MVYQFGRINNRSQALRELGKLRIAYLLDDIKKNPDKYPSDRMEWVEWLNKESGNNMDEF